MAAVMSELQSLGGLSTPSPHPAPGESVRLPIYFFAIAVFSFALGTATAPWAALKLADYFYQLSVLSWVHTFTMGWITSAMLGVMYRYVPAITQREVTRGEESLRSGRGCPAVLSGERQPATKSPFLHLNPGPGNSLRGGKATEQRTAALEGGGLWRRWR